MVTRNLTDVFVLMRNNASQNRNIYSDQIINDRMALVEAGGIELAQREDYETPQWGDTLEEARYSITRLREKLKELAALQEVHMQRPTFDESTHQELQMEVLTQEISKMFSRIQRLVQQIRHASENDRKDQERRLSYSVITSLLTSLQELTNHFRGLQSSYLNRLDSREERSRLDFGSKEEDRELFSVNGFNDADWETECIDERFRVTKPGQSISEQQMLLIEEDNAKTAEMRDKQVSSIVQSIVDLNVLFKDLSTMVVEQGTVLDRIDYTLEQTSIGVSQGYEQLVKADRSHAKNRKMMCIMCLAPVTLIMLFLLIIIKF
ncbi:unnamed protein product [Bemisia tabaci]|uniref:t-SNARE coiled-coil homology domain-containing protein n=1 Tax=Bemisia tabaci TaxID=7038 RepID=A0A9P0A683_BEMTA|nr:PREDICTED: syntaxin-16 [Bemisia tabaci]CAH0384028.1 unnamed protein product [Bemisia tabaci]